MKLTYILNSDKSKIRNKEFVAKIRNKEFAASWEPNYIDLWNSHWNTILLYYKLNVKRRLKGKKNLNLKFAFYYQYLKLT